MKLRYKFNLFHKLALVTSTIAVVLALVSCDPNDFKLPAWQPEFILPLVNAELGIENFILNTKGVSAGDDGLITISYNEHQSLGTLEELFPVHDQEVEFTLPSIPGLFASFGVQAKIDLATLGIDEGSNKDIKPFSIDRVLDVDIAEYFKEARFEEGKIELSIQNNLPIVLKQGLRLRITNVGSETAIYDYTITQDVNTNRTFYLQDVNLQGKVLLGALKFELYNLASDGASNIDLHDSNFIQIGVAFKDIVLDSATLKLSKLDYKSSQIKLPFVFDNGALLTEASIDNALIELESDGQIVAGLSVNIIIPNANNPGQPFVLPFDSNKSSVALTDFVLDLTANNSSQNILLVAIELIADDDGFVTLIFNKSYDAKIRFKDIDYGYLKGYLGAFKSIVEGGVKLDFLNNVQSGKLIFNDPRIKLSIKNTQGVIGTFFNDTKGLYIKGKNELLYPNEEIEVGTSLQTSSFNGAISIGEVSDVDFTINSTTEPKFNEFIGLLPTDIDYRLPVSFGTSTPDLGQFIYDKGVIAYDFNMELPLELTADNLILTDTLLNDFESDYNDLEMIKATLTATVTNYFPLNLIVQNYYLDDNYKVIDSLFLNNPNATAANLDESGKVVDPSISEFSVVVFKEKLQNIKKAKYYKPVMHMRTTDQRKVKLLSEYTVQLNIVGALDLNIDLNK